MKNNSSVTIEMTSSDRTFYLIYDVLLIFLGITITISNMFIIGIYCFTKKIRTKTANLLLCNQAIVDIYNGAIAGGITIFSHYASSNVKQGIYQFSLALSLHTIVLISVERYIFILRPLFHRTSVTMEKILVAVVISWLLSLVWIPFRLMHYQGDSMDWESYVYFIAISDTVIFVLIVVVGCLHVLTYRAVKSFMMCRLNELINVSKRKGVCLKENIKYKHHLKEVRVSKIFISMFVAFTCTYLPVFMTGIFYIAGGFVLVNQSDYKYFSLDLIFYLYNSLFNPIVTLAFKEDYRKNFRKFVNTWFDRVLHMMCTCKLYAKRYNLAVSRSSSPPSLRRTLSSNTDDKGPTDEHEPTADGGDGYELTSVVQHCNNGTFFSRAARYRARMIGQDVINDDVMR